jgi:hypothetical protein
MCIFRYIYSFVYFKNNMHLGTNIQIIQKILGILYTINTHFPFYSTARNTLFRNAITYHLLVFRTHNLPNADTPHFSISWFILPLFSYKSFKGIFLSLVKEQQRIVSLSYVFHFHSYRNNLHWVCMTIIISYMC